MYSRQQYGFGLPEISIGLAILTIFCSIAVPATSALIDSQRASAYIRQLSQQLAYARVTAASSNLPVQLCPRHADACVEQWQQNPIQVALLYPEQRELLRELPKVHPTHKLVYNRAALTFRRDGSLDGFQNGTFVYCAKPGTDWHYRLVVNQAGRNRLTQISSPCPV